MNTTVKQPSADFLEYFRERELPHIRTFIEIGLHTGNSPFQCLDRALNAAVIALADPKETDLRRRAARQFRDACLHKPSAAERFIKACIEGVVDVQSFEGGQN